ncbi:unnamed protein product [Prunus armeniaca]|uniref:Exonuclease domain-containing protein n=1 Tax=Prunus armeniaca TaxID=36596 RepID=A0A6J5XUD7_PRUAR|nr:unnamed protein product [Prunus armeniaca]
MHNLLDSINFVVVVAVQSLVCSTLKHPQYPLDYSFPSHEQDWVVSKRGKKSNATISNGMVAVGCEMVLCEDGSEALVKVCVVDGSLQVKLDELVNPRKKVADYRTEITGSVLGYEVRKPGSPHNCLDDACAAMKLVLAKIKREIGDIIPPVQEDVREVNMAKLLHRIPITVPSEELHNAIPGNYTVEVKITLVQCALEGNNK